MAIKKLRDGYTTLEQSQKLLELGVPADSADCRYENNWSHVETHKPVYTKIMHGHPIHNDDMPCWSVGRLIRILSICCSYRYYLPVDYCTVEYIVAIISYEIKLNRIDFSKLEE